MTEVASALGAADALDSEASGELDKELIAIEAELEAAEGGVVRDLRSMVSVVRGTLYQKSANLTDAQVQEMNKSFTYSNPKYWDDYYNKTSEDERFDWYGSWDTSVQEIVASGEGAEERRDKTVGDILGQYLVTDSKILMLGCGNSDMSEKMYKQGFEEIVNVDISENLLDKLRQRLAAASPRMRWQYANASSLDFADKSFDVTVDKGTFDAMEQNKPLVKAAFGEVHRTLRPGGFVLSVTFNSAEKRIDNQLRKADDWGDCHTHVFERVPQQNRYYVHACQRRP